jgi:hypothetical protein
MISRMSTTSAIRTYRFSITVTVEPGDPGYDDPEWVADAAQGAPANLYGYVCSYGDIIALDESEFPEP